VIATGGQTVRRAEGQVHVGGRRVPQPCLGDGGAVPQDTWTMQALRVPVGSVLVLGDHRGGRRYRRSTGPVKVSAVGGAALRLGRPFRDVGQIRQ